MRESTGWVLRSIEAVDGTTYRVALAAEGQADQEFVFAADQVSVAGRPVVVVSCLEFAERTAGDPGAARGVLNAVMTFHTTRSVALALDRPPATRAF
ncbi:hypothetical protein F4553_000926 [Allocatelliglobosispora scoriae]|uniref:Uncharacterized protein n=1 Tax=Allocatelliglobosispora scoriae TaxID=643052 RepID=A0A841BEN7_9ACTN|nr:hypothetical protein [Allocatelliglobosispora scoriae]MBB5867547.1 hypothetical protein [Allocatelliglobosispora scoriae]